MLWRRIARTMRWPFRKRPEPPLLVSLELGPEQKLLPGRVTVSELSSYEDVEAWRKRMADEEHTGPPPWQRQSPFVDGIVKLMMGVAQSFAALPNQCWGLIILGLGCWMLQYANERTLALIGGVIGAGSSLLTTGIGKKNEPR